MADPYSVLGVAKSADAEAIKRAYRKLAKELHPDRNKDNPKAVERFKAVSSAYELLSDAGKRAQYDRGEIDGEGNPKGFAPGGGFGGGFGGGGFRQRPGGFEFSGDPGDIFSELFRQQGSPFGGAGFRQPPAKGPDRAYRLAVPFVDAALARPQRITLADGKTIDLAIPKGVEDGQKMRLAGKGEPGPGGPGDAIVTLAISPDARFERAGDDVRLDVMVPLADAVLGGKVRAELLDGAVMLNVAEGTSSGRLLRLRGKGWTRKDGSRGDAIVRLLLALPAEEKSLEALQAWATGVRGEAFGGV
ncbi:DnaJ C-terminal domain-containing protein [Sandaracinobacteroides saxicola]|uniref:J domain-containing protein n=1 Tax=Sandaracinobacteroides saxicola TaxID=2759707 RepID=A0A7G5IFB3_9SPHN|nr:DnaJ C-terminal domain-containing protein [Sandaracinobacteroides saxicola]QMW22055.1 J domain-containing protein [Sandaracinobacteroides saxicola]